jgi:hypothetical protein
MYAIIFEELQNMMRLKPKDEITHYTQAANHPPVTIFSTSCSMPLWLFSRLESGLKGHGFVPTEEIQQDMTADLIATPKGLPQVLPTMVGLQEQVSMYRAAVHQG